jgi:hypothetical protein
MPRRRLAVLVACLALSAPSVRLGAGESPQTTSARPAAPSPHRATLDRYCITCHNERMKTGGLSLDGLDVANVERDADTWEKVVRKLRGRMMPPAGLPRPVDATYDALVAHLERNRARRDY